MRLWSPSQSHEASSLGQAGEVKKLPPHKAALGASTPESETRAALAPSPLLVPLQPVTVFPAASRTLRTEEPEKQIFLN